MVFCSVGHTGDVVVVGDLPEKRAVDNGYVTVKMNDAFEPNKVIETGIV